MDDPDYVCKVIFLGDAGVGKSSILRRYHRDTFTNLAEHTIGVDFFTTLMKRDSMLYKIQIWDTAGQERFNSLITSYFKESTMAVIVFDTTDHASFLNVQKWINEYEQICSIENTSTTLNLTKPLIIVGNKCDKLQNRVVRKQDVHKYLDDNFISAKYIEVSAKENLHIEQIYQEILDFCSSLVQCYDIETLKKYYAIKKIEKVRSFYMSSSSLTGRVKRPSKCCIIS
jgi:small GTP-binding protein